MFLWGSILDQPLSVDFWDRTGPILKALYKLYAFKILYSCRGLQIHRKLLKMCRNLCFLSGDLEILVMNHNL